MLLYLIYRRLRRMEIKLDLVLDVLIAGDGERLDRLRAKLDKSGKRLARAVREAGSPP